MSKDINKQLAKCPFCGGEAQECNTGNHFLNTYYWVRCKKCGCKLQQSVVREYVIEAWNTRKPMDRIVERLEEEYGTVLYEDGVIVGYDKGFIHIDEAIAIVKEEGGL